MTNFPRTAAVAVAAALLSTTAAPAHVSLEQATAAAGTTTKVTLRVPHGCDGEATHTLRVTLPDGFYAAQPMPKAGWQLATETGPYAIPYNNHGTEMTEGLRGVIWSEGNLESDWYDEFTLRGTVGAELAAGTVLSFPIVQTCANGTAEWTGDMAPGLTVTAAPSGDHGHGQGHGHDHAAATPADSWSVGDLAISGAFSRATLPNAPVAGGFLTIANNGAEDDVLTGAATPAAGRVEVHDMRMDGDVMRMRELPEGLPLPAGETVTLAPGGYHLMLMDLAAPLAAGDTVPLTLQFRDAGEVEITLTVGSPAARTAPEGGGHGDHGHGNHGDHGAQMPHAQHEGHN